MDLKQRLWDLWEIPEEHRTPAVQTLQKIFSNILKTPENEKFRDLNFSKIRRKFEKTKPAFYLLYTAGFNQDVTGARLVFGYTTVNLKQLREVNETLNKKIANPDDKSLIPKSKLPKNEQNDDSPSSKAIKDKHFRKNFQSSSNAKHEREERDKQAYLQRQKSIDDNDNKESANNDENNDKNTDETEVEDTRTEEEKEKEKASHSEVRGALDDLDESDKELLRQIQESKGTTVKLSMDELAGKTKEEKIAIFKQKQNQFRKEKGQAARRAEIDREKKRRENVKLAAEARAKREEQQRAMIASKKKRDKQEAKLRKQRIREQIKKDKEAKAREKKLAEQRKQQGLN